MTDRILEGLTEHQVEAVRAVEGPVAIMAGAGTGKTTVISRRAAYAVATGVVEARRMLLVTFTEKAAAEMIARVRALGLDAARAGDPGGPRGGLGGAASGAVTARTFHSAALAQLRHFWPLRYDGRPLPEVLADKYRLVAPLARRLPGGYRFTPARDLIDEIEWAKSRRLDPESYASQVGVPGGAAGTDARDPPIPLELFARLFRDYERAKSRQGLIDFDDMLTRVVDLLESDDDAVRAVHGRFSWFSVDEYQDTSPLQQRLLDLWVGDRRDLCVVGDEDQTIYTFAGATPEYLTGFARRFPDARVIPLLDNHRSSPQVLELANRLIASTGRTKRLLATRGPGPAPTVRALPSAEAEEAAIVARVRELTSSGVPPGEVAVLVRLNAQIPAFEAAFTRAGIPYRVRGQRFFERRDVRSGVEALRRLPDDVTRSTLMTEARRLFAERLGFDPDEETQGAEARERQAALATLLGIVADTADHPGAPLRDAVLAALARRADEEQATSDEGVELLTLHRAKGLEWEAVFLPALEEGLLPVAQAADDVPALDEERRLLYVGITRARRHLWLSWAQERPTSTGRSGRRRPSRFLRVLSADDGPGMRRLRAAPIDPARAPARTPSDPGDPLFVALKAWRLARARSDGVPPYVIAHDATLMAIAERRPRTLDDLALVPGMGPARLARFGPEMLDVSRAAGLADG